MKKFIIFTLILGIVISQNPLIWAAKSFVLKAKPAAETHLPGIGLISRSDAGLGQQIPTILSNVSLNGSLREGDGAGLLLGHETVSPFSAATLLEGNLDVIQRGSTVSMTALIPTSSSSGLKIEGLDPIIRAVRSPSLRPVASALKRVVKVADKFRDLPVDTPSDALASSGETIMQEIAMPFTLAKPDIIPAREQVLREVSPEEKAREPHVLNREIFESLDHEHPVDQPNVENLALAVQRGDWAYPIFLDSAEACHLALAAYRQKWITLGQFITIVMRWEAIQQLKVSPSSVYVRSARGIEFQLVQRVPRFLKSIAELPASEQFIFLFPVREKLFLERKSIQMYNGIDQRKMPNTIALPSFGILQSLLMARFGNNAVQLQPAFGLVDHQAVVEGISRGGRVFGLGFPGLDFKHLSGSPYHYTNHDYGHAERLSRIDIKIRRQWKHIYAIGVAGIERLDSGMPFSSSISDHPSRHRIKTVLEYELPEFGIFVDLAPNISIFNLLDQSCTLLNESPKAFRFSALIVKDMILHPENWHGWNIQEEISKMSLFAQSI